MENMKNMNNKQENYHLFKKNIKENDLKEFT